MTDREMLELAAKAAGIENLATKGNTIIHTDEDGYSAVWNPLTDDGDALRLAVKLRISPILRASGCDASDAQKAMAYERYRDDPYAATRLAITRAAAEIGKSMEGKNA